MSPLSLAIVWGGLLCGTLDAVAAMIAFRTQGIPPRRAWHGVASGLLGMQAFEQGSATAALGLFLHYCVAFLAATVFCVFASFCPAVLARPLLVGPAYGVVVFLFMSIIVMPLSRRPKRPLTVSAVVTQFCIHMVCVGSPIVFSAAHFLARV